MVKYLDIWKFFCNHLKAIAFFIFCFTDFFFNKLWSEDEIKIKIKFIRTIFQLNKIEGNTNRVSFDFIQLENGLNEFYFLFNQPSCRRIDKRKKHN